MKINQFDDIEILIHELSEYLAELVSKTAGECHIALSGGSTPKKWFSFLSAHYKNKIDWNKIHFYWGDERCVPPDHEESNYLMTKKHLFDQLGIIDTQIHRIKGELSPEQATKEFDQEMCAQMPLKDNIPVFDLMILGMGDDGHTASIFPHEIGLWDAKGNTVIATHPVSGQKRVSLTGKVINASKNVVFLVTGSNKAEKVQSIIEKKRDYESYPASLVAPQSGKLDWYLDSEAARLLD